MHLEKLTDFTDLQICRSGTNGKLLISGISTWNFAILTSDSCSVGLNWYISKKKTHQNWSIFKEIGRFDRSADLDLHWGSAWMQNCWFEALLVGILHFWLQIHTLWGWIDIFKKKSIKISPFLRKLEDLTDFTDLQI